MAKKKRPRKQLDIPPAIAKKIKSLSEELGVPESQIYAYFAAKGLVSGVEKTDLFSRLRPSKSLRWSYNVDLDDLIKFLDSDD